MISCKECGVECSAQNALSFHLRTHGLTYDGYVVKHEYGGVWPTCLNCKTKLTRKKGGFNRFCGKSCASSGEFNAMGRLKGEDSPNYGQRTTEQLFNYSAGARKRWDHHGEMLRDMMKTPEYKAAQAQSRYELAAKDPTYNKRRTDGTKRFWKSDSGLTKQRRDEASQRAVILNMQNKIGPHAPFKRELKHNPFTGKEEYMHSSWESNFLDMCIKIGCPVTKDHGIVIAYMQVDGTEHRYIPDFKHLELNKLFEVKGRMTDVDERKIIAAEAAGYDVVLIDHNPG